MQNDLSKIKQELDAITKSIVENIPVEEIYLFGSFAYGMPGKDSDIDSQAWVHTPELAPVSIS